MSDTTKICSGCKRVKPLAEFGRRLSSNTGVDYQCRGCIAAKARESSAPAGPPRVIVCRICDTRRETRRPATRYCSERCRKIAADRRRAERVAQRAALGRPCHKCGIVVTTRVGLPVCDGCKLDYRADSPERERRRTLRKYGITEADWDRMVAEQGNRCAICRTDQPGGKGERWHIDHCHVTNRVRGLLCHNCNVGIGNFKDDPGLLKAAASYLDAVM